ncbi:MAG: sulfate reduction electron transfer complex DsrMKJOP subunit DsrM [Planctomycetes bacterium]|nr:sulfate reduction electron transfer complex DsrMKJOP subunit DsrM [Planctomycetota bacterium]
MNVLISLAAVGGLFLLGTLGGAPGMGWIFGVVLPYLAVGIGIGGLIWRVMSWANVPVPFRIPTTCGQQKSLPWIKSNPLENPHNGLTAVGRMALEVLFFRSLLRNTKAEVIDQRRLVYTSAPWLWIGAMAFHWSFLIILVRHLRLLANPVPWCVTFLQRADGFLEIGLPVIYVTTVLFLAGLAYLLARRLASPQLRYISLAGDYFPLFLFLGIGISGFWLRHWTKTDIVSVKQVAVGLSGFSFDSDALAAAGSLFYGHLFLVCVLLAYFPFSKLSHFAGVFLSPTRNMANSNRSVRHVNPWDYPVKVHPYDEYEDEFREKMKGAGVPVEKE